MKDTVIIMVTVFLIALLASCTTEKHTIFKENESFERFFSKKAYMCETYSKQAPQLGENISIEKVSINETNYTKVKIIDTCMEITEPGNYIISTSLLSSDSCIIVKVDNVSIDGRNYELTGALDFPKYGDKEMNKKIIKKLGKISGIIAKNVKNIAVKNIKS